MEAPHNNALLLFRVGPVLCAAPSLPIVSIISPPKLTHPPGSSPANPGIFYHSEHVVSITDLRYQFGLDESEWTQPGRLIITEADGVYDALWVDDIIEVIEAPKEGWGPLPSLLPKKIFSHTLLIDEKIHLYTELRQLVDIDESGVLRQYIEKLQQNPELVDDSSTNEPAEEKPPAKASNGEKDTATESQHAMDPIEETNKPETMAQDEVPEMDANETSPLTTAKTIPATDVIPAATEQSHDEVNQTSSEPLPVESPHELEEVPATTADETISAVATEAETTEDIVAEEQMSPIIADETDLQVVDDITTPEDEESTSSQDTSPAAEQAPTNDINDQKIDPSHIKTKIDARLIVTDEPDIPLILDENHGNHAATIVTDKDIYRTEKSKLTLVIIALVATLLLAAISSGLYYFFVTPNEIVTSKAIMPIPDKASEVETSATETAAKETIEIMEEKQKETPTSNDYHADIKPDKEGITIVLHTPEGVPVLREDTIASVKEPVTKKTAPEEKEGKKTTTPKSRTEVIHTVVKGDTLWAIAEHYVKDPYRYPELARLSKIKNPDRIYPGNRVRIIDKNGKL